MTDYDQTLTKLKFHDGSSGDNSFRTIINYEHTPPKVKIDTQALYKHYFPIERDLSLSKEEKAKHMLDWWTQDFMAFSEAGYSRSCFTKMV